MNLDFFKRVRKNHALEHATIGIAHSRMDDPGVLAGNSTAGGFLVYGNVPTDLLEESAAEALRRLRSGERQLAITPLCGTNIVVTALLAGVACTWAMGRERSIARLPNVVSAATFAIIAGRLLGRVVQKHVTTDSDIGELEIKGIQHVGVGGARVHLVRTE